MPPQNGITEYISALISEIKRVGKEFSDKRFDSIFIGGGTPSLMNGEDAARLFWAIYENFKIENEVEFTTEANPESLTEEYLKAFTDFKGNRLSLGVQSLCDAECAAVGRITSKEKVFSAVDLAKKAGIKNISCDVILGLPMQTKDSLLKTVSKLLDLEICHLSLYSLKTDEGTPLFERKGSLSFPTEEEEFSFYKSAVGYLTERGFERYEISNFALPGYESRHNGKYWDQSEYLGLGPGAHSFMNGERFYNESDLSKYLKCESRIYDSDDEIISGSLSEQLMLALRTSKGFSVDLLSPTARSFHKELISHGLAENREDKVVLTDEGLWVMNEIILKFEEFI